MAAVTHPRLDEDQYRALQFRAGWRLPAELIDGEVVVTPPTGGPASSAQGEIFLALGSWRERTGDGGLLLQDVFVRLPGGNIVAPDIAWWEAGRRPPLAQGAVEAVPDLVVEVLSPGTRDNDLGAKRDVYERAGVRELWLADPGPPSLVILRASAGSFKATTLASNDEVHSPLLAGFSVRLDRVFGEY